MAWIRAVAELYFGEQTEKSVRQVGGWLGRRLHVNTGLLFELLARRVYPRMPVKKNPDVVYQMNALERIREMFPSVRFIHLLRHPRGHGESNLKYYRLRARAGHNFQNVSAHTVNTSGTMRLSAPGCGSVPGEASDARHRLRTNRQLPARFSSLRRRGRFPPSSARCWASTRRCSDCPSCTCSISRMSVSALSAREARGSLTVCCARWQSYVLEGKLKRPSDAPEAGSGAARISALAILSRPSRASFSRGCWYKKARASCGSAATWSACV